MTGHVSHNVSRLMTSLSDIFFLPSRIEGIALAVAEAMSMGLPIISTAAGGQYELFGIGHNNKQLQQQEHAIEGL